MHLWLPTQLREMDIDNQTARSDRSGSSTCTVRFGGIDEYTDIDTKIQTA